MNHRIERLQKRAQHGSPRIALLSMYDVENNAVRILAATLRQAGYPVAEIYFKDWVSNHLFPATDEELANLVRVLLREEINLVCVSLRASAYLNSARILTEHIHEVLDLPVLWGGMHPTLMPEQCLESADLIIKGEGEHALLDLVERLDRGEDLRDCPNLGYVEDGAPRVNPLRPLIGDLDTLAYRDYTTHESKYFVSGKRYVSGDPMHGDPVYQLMGSRGCIYKCSYCYNSTYKKDVYPGQKWFRVRSPASMVEEIKAARRHWDFKRIRFDDEVFNFQKAWLQDFCEIYPREVGLPFEIFIEPKLVNEDRMRMLRDAGLVSVYMGIQSSERVTGHLYDRRVKNRTVEDIARLYHRLGIKPHFQLIFDDPVSTAADRETLFELVSGFPRPFDLYLFSMTVFPGSELNHKLIQNGIISEYDIEGTNTRVFYQHRVNLEYPRPVEETFWISLIQMMSKGFVPRPMLRALSRSEFLKRHPWPLIKMAHSANFLKMGGMAGKMMVEGEMTKTLWRRWASMDTVITT